MRIADGASVSGRLDCHASSPLLSLCKGKTALLKRLEPNMSRCWNLDAPTCSLMMLRGCAWKHWDELFENVIALS